MEKILTEYEKGWLDAAIDFDGCISLLKKHWQEYTEYASVTYHIQVTIVNTKIASLEKAKQILDSGGICPYGGSNPRHNQSYQYRFSTSVLRFVLPQLRLTIKEEQRLIALAVLDIVGYQSGHGRRGYSVEERELLESMYWEMKELNRRGIVIDEELR